MTTLAVPATRAVVRPIDPGAEFVYCPVERGGCGEEVKFVAQVPSAYRLRVIANVYFAGAWNRTEQWHLFPCYVAAGMPYGRPDNLADGQLELMHAVLERAGANEAEPAKLLALLVEHARVAGVRMNISIPRRRRL